MPAPQKQRHIEQQAREEGCREFDLTRGPRCHWRILRSGHNEYVMMLTFHHIIADGWAVSLFFREFTEMYFRLEQGITPVVDNFLQFSDYALAENQWQSNDHYHQGLAYWKKRRDGVQGILDIVTDAPGNTLYVTQTADAILAASIRIQAQVISFNDLFFIMG